MQPPSHHLSFVVSRPASFQTDCNELKKREHLVRYFKIRSSDIGKLDDHIFMGIKIEHLYIHDSSEYIARRKWHGENFFLSKTYMEMETTHDS